MSQLVVLMLLGAVPVGPSIGDITFRHANAGATPVDFVTLPPKVPDCRTDEEIRISLAEKANGIVPQSCDPPKARLRAPIENQRN